MNRLRTSFLAPAAVVMVLLFLVPLTIICAYSAMTRGAYFGVGPPWTIENYARVFDSLYGGVLVRSFLLAAVSTLLCLVLGLPLALFISRTGPSRRSLYLNLVILPFWTSFLVRIYAWIFLLRDTGLINSLLQNLGLIHAPLPMLYNDGAVILGLVYGYLPFMVLPLYATLERLDPFLVEAAADLGARPITTFWRVVLPLCAPGIRAGTVLVFIPCLGAFLVPDLLGGGKSIMIGNIVQNQFTTARDWPFGSALSLVLMAIVGVLLLAALGRRNQDLL
jgi:spermidine/putrescine transport system permease protein